MANAPDSAATDLDDRDFGVAVLARAASWGIGAATALLLAVLAGFSESGAPRVMAAVSALSGSQRMEATAIAPIAKPRPAPVVPPKPQPPQLVAEARRLTEQVRLLAADRDRLMQRVAELERNLDQVTGSIRRQEASARTQAESVELPAPAAAIAMAPAPWRPLPPQQPTKTPWNERASSAEAAASEIVTGALSSPTKPASATPLPPPRPASPPPTAETQAPTESSPAGPAPPRQAAGPATPEERRTAYGVDLGGAASLNRLRMLWQSLRINEPRLLQGLHPVTYVREIRRGGRPDVRLIAGPLASADHAARLCAAILDAGRFCEPAVFHGHRLR